MAKPDPPPGQVRAASLLEKIREQISAGLISSVVAEAVLFPIDTLKLRQQVSGGRIIDISRTILREQGALGFYQGLIGRLIQTITSNVGFFIWQTILMQAAAVQLCSGGDPESPPRLSTVLSLVVNMVAQQINRVLTTPVDVVANVNQGDPQSKGFFHTFVKLARTGGRATLWRGLGVSLLLSLNPALMFTLVEKLSGLVGTLRDGGGPLRSSDMFWVSGVSKAVATVVTYPLIRAKAVIQTQGSALGLWATLATVAREQGPGALYAGVWVMSYKTILFNSLMMALKQQVTALLRGRKPSRPIISEGAWRDKVVLVNGPEMPWVAAARQATVVYVDGSWATLHAAQQHLLAEAARRGDHLVVGVHGDACQREATGSWPCECFSQRLERLKGHTAVGSILEEAPWEVGEDLVTQLGISHVLSGSFTKVMDTATPESPPTARLKDPYAACKKLGLYEEIPSLDSTTEYEAWRMRVQRILFANVDASIDWRILVADGASAPVGQNPGYAR